MKTTLSVSVTLLTVSRNIPPTISTNSRPLLIRMWLQSGDHRACSIHGSSSGSQFLSPCPQEKQRTKSSWPEVERLILRYLLQIHDWHFIFKLECVRITRMSFLLTLSETNTVSLVCICTIKHLLVCVNHHPVLPMDVEYAE